jgi:hypothetical protein
MEVGGELHDLSSLPPGKKSPQYLQNKRLFGPQSWYGCFGEDEKSTLLLLRNEL